MDLRYYRISVDGENYYRQCHPYRGDVGKLMDEEELIERLMDQVVTEEVELTDVTVEIALDNILSKESRQTVEHYIMYLKHLADID